MNSIFISWFSSALFCLGILIVILGFLMIIIPKQIHTIGEKLNFWVSTDSFFTEVDKPRFLERYVYKHHYLVGTLIMFGSLYCLYIFLIEKDLELMLSNLPWINGNKMLAEWIYESLIYVLIFANFLCFLIGIIIFIRPSLLKSIERLSNRWVDNDRFFKRLDSTRSIPEHVLPGNMRLFGLAVIMGGFYIVFVTGTSIFIK